MNPTQATPDRPSFGCCSFRIKAEDGTCVVARVNELGMEARSQIVFQPSGRSFTSKAPGGGPGKTWTSRYAFLGINGLGLPASFGDGMNEAGLSMEGLFFDDSRYEAPGPGEAAVSVGSNDFVSWVLGNFATVDEVKAALASVRVWSETVGAVGATFPLHFAIHDAAGRCIVVEFIDGEKKVYDNPLGVMTNLPELPWHLTNLGNYLNLNTRIPGSIDFAGTMARPFGTGGGWLGMPGDWTSPSKFVRIAYLVHCTGSPRDRAGAINLAKHILNTVDIPKRSVDAQIKNEKTGDGLDGEYSQWSLLLDLTNRVMFYFTYDDMNLKCIDLRKMVRDGTREVRVIPMEQDFSAVDMTDRMTSPGQGPGRG
ncbi:MAG: choloylglycine hydrolase family protein [Deltaproteobacteria bacterium]